MKKKLEYPPPPPLDSAHVLNHDSTHLRYMLFSYGFTIILVFVICLVFVCILGKENCERVVAMYVDSR